MLPGDYFSHLHDPLALELRPHSKPAVRDSISPSHRQQEPGPTNTSASPRLKGDYQSYPSRPFGYSEEYAGLDALQNAGLQHTGNHDCFSFCTADFVYNLLWGGTVYAYESY